MPVKDLVRAKITPQLRTKYQSIGPSLIAEHGKDLQHAANHQPSISPAPRYSSSSHVAQKDDPASSSATSTSTSSANGPSINVTTLHDVEEFRTTAAELYATLTDPQRIAAFTRAPPKRFEGAVPGAKFEIFGGNVAGEYSELRAPELIVQKWRLAQWPAGHYSTLRIRFEQNDVDAVTVMRVEWRGVPVGQEEPTKRNWGEYYVRSIKTTFGFGAIL